MREPWGAGHRERKKVIDSAGREVPINESALVRGYILADWNDKLERYLKMQDFILTNFGGQMAYRYYKELNLIIEVLVFDRLVDRASNRNEAFVKILNSESNYDLSPKRALSAAE